MNDQEKLIWNSELSIGNLAIDDDHKQLIEIYNELVDFNESQGSNESFAKILSKMTDYSLDHFKKEEKYMEKFNYPKLTEHKKFHRDYIYKVAMYNVDLLKRNPPDPKEIINFLGKWWLNHTLINDKEYENFKNKIKSDARY